MFSWLKEKLSNVWNTVVEWYNKLSSYNANDGEYNNASENASEPINNNTPEGYKQQYNLNNSGYPSNSDPAPMHSLPNQSNPPFNVDNIRDNRSDNSFCLLKDEPAVPSVKENNKINKQNDNSKENPFSIF